MDGAATKTGSPHWTSATQNVLVSKISSLYKQHDENMDIYVWVFIGPEKKILFA